MLFHARRLCWYFRERAGDAAAIIRLLPPYDTDFMPFRFILRWCCRWGAAEAAAECHEWASALALPAMHGTRAEARCYVTPARRAWHALRAFVIMVKDAATDAVYRRRDCFDVAYALWCFTFDAATTPPSTAALILPPFLRLLRWFLRVYALLIAYAHLLCAPASRQRYARHVSVWLMMLAACRVFRCYSDRREARRLPSAAPYWYFHYAILFLDAVISLIRCHFDYFISIFHWWLLPPCFRHAAAIFWFLHFDADYFFHFHALIFIFLYFRHIFHYLWYFFFRQLRWRRFYLYLFIIFATLFSLLFSCWLIAGLLWHFHATLRLSCCRHCICRFIVSCHAGRIADGYRQLLCHITAAAAMLQMAFRYFHTKFFFFYAAAGCRYFW